jgi:hypothetical protein
VQKRQFLLLQRWLDKNQVSFQWFFFFLQHVVGKFYTLQAMTGKNCSKITSPPPPTKLCAKLNLDGISWGKRAIWMTYLVVNFTGRSFVHHGREAGARGSESRGSHSLMGGRCYCVCPINTQDRVTSTGWYMTLKAKPCALIIRLLQPCERILKCFLASTSLLIFMMS